MGEAPKLLYIVVADEGGERAASFRYTRPVLQSTLQLMGCKARHAFKISRRVFEVIGSEYSCLGLPRQSSTADTLVKEPDGKQPCCLDQGEATDSVVGVNSETTDALPFELYKRQTTVVVTRENFLNVTCNALSEYKYVGPNQRADFVLACRIRERKGSVTVLLCGTSGCGKSTLSALLGSRLGVTTVISTDSIRHMMRSFADEKQNPLLWASTYHAGECLDPVAVAEAKAKRKAKKLDVLSHSTAKDELSYEKVAIQSPELSPVTELIGQKQLAIDGFKAQSEMVIDSLDRLITAWEDRKESVVVEGVHLSLNFVMGLMKKHPSIVPFMVYITNEDKHMERFAVRAKYMTLDPSKNKYVKYIRNIRKIQEYLCNRADKHLVPKINNTNVDRSVAVIHATVFSCLRRREAGEQLYDPSTNTVPVIYEEYRNQRAANTVSSKGMFQLIQRHGSSRHLMALLNIDGSVAKAWPVLSVDDEGPLASGTGGERCVGKPMYGPLLIGKAEPVNLQFGNYGISAWPSDTGGTSHTGSLDDSKADGTETGSRYFSSCCTSPRMSDGPSKELKENVSVAGSEEEEADDDPPDADSDEDLSDVDNKEIHHEMEGSVDEDSTKSDEEYDDLAILDGEGNRYWSDEEEPSNERKVTAPTEDTKYQQNLDLFLKLTQHLTEPPCSFYLLPEANKGSMLLETNSVSSDARMRKRSLSDSSRFQSWTQSITEIGSSGLYNTPMISVATER